MSSAEERHVGPTATRLGARHCELKIEDHELKLDVHSHELNRYYVAPTRPLRHRSCRPPCSSVFTTIRPRPYLSRPLALNPSQPSVSRFSSARQIVSVFRVTTTHRVPACSQPISWLAPSSLDYALSSAAQLSNATTIFNATPPPLSRPSGKLVKLFHTHDTSTYPSSVCAYRASSCAALSTGSHLMDGGACLQLQDVWYTRDVVRWQMSHTYGTYSLSGPARSSPPPVHCVTH